MDCHQSLKSGMQIVFFTPDIRKQPHIFLSGLYKWHFINLKYGLLSVLQSELHISSGIELFDVF